MFWLILLIPSFIICCEPKQSKYFCDIYYDCINNNLIMKSCNNNEVRYNNTCITQSEYKNITGNYCHRCNKNILIPGIHYNPLMCNKLSNSMCCFEEDNYIIYCTEQNNKYIWIKDYYNTDCKSILEKIKY
ncbi:hypothetical protein AMVITR04b [Betaentomopoxvirus amoorei]|uniref:AMVITR04 n=1 Tax=Amsacta moorei entomopoxvirus TaxID=28321 RepID=Q9DHC5_AMEPV|nr:hypothetical protein AMVITR04a [Amsacta moorei entomopoxvirus]NP_065058.1 hypothetical protein AMVITR04b [Amsacta moorei entomopoxvirus]AAG02976.1 AMVITR04 [Amsacta moorei entomopoxvirus]AAG02987.1 AMVITR04 [Amsacta moorei entomopoxvirus]